MVICLIKKRKIGNIYTHIPKKKKKKSGRGGFKLEFLTGIEHTFS
jgi:hypothetical protein